MRPTPLREPFRRRMAVLALLAGTLVGVVLPAVYSQRLFAERASEASLWAQQLAERYELSASIRPRLWSYDLSRLNEMSASVISDPIAGRVCIDTPQRQPAFCAGPSSEVEVAGWSAIVSRDKIVGRVRVVLDGGELQRVSQVAWLSAGTLGLILGLALFFLPTATVRRGDEQQESLWQTILEANAELEARVRDRTEALAKSEGQLRKLSARLVAAQEDERARISRDLHDDLGQILTALRLRLTTAQALQESGAATAPHIEAALEAVDTGVDQVRGLAHRLRPVALDRLGLTDALDGLVLDWSQTTSVIVETYWSEEEPDGPDAEVLFRVAQEALTNIARHADASRVHVEMSSTEGRWTLTLQDDGSGLSGQSTDGLGLLGLRERLAERSGELKLDRSSLGGLCLSASIPRASNEQGNQG